MSEGVAAILSIALSCLAIWAITNIALWMDKRNRDRARDRFQRKNPHW